MVQSRPAPSGKISISEQNTQFGNFSEFLRIFQNFSEFLKTFQNFGTFRNKMVCTHLNPGCSELPLEGYVQSKEKLEEYILQRWFSAAWSPVGGHCSRSDAYQSFRAPHPDYVRLSLHGKAALNEGGRPEKSKEVTLITDNASSDKASRKCLL